MRIRTVKPEFWANEKMAKLDDFTRLLAIGLLNYADDHGYFWANPLLIRGALFPFDEDSTKIRRSLAKLSADGYIRVGKTKDGRDGGLVVKFSSHQRVDRPQDSRIKDLITFDEDSTNNRRTLDDQSLLDQVSGNRDQGSGNMEHVLPAPAGAEAIEPKPEELIYEEYPRKQKRADALKAIKKALKVKPFADLIEATKAYAAATAEWPVETRDFIPYPASWFNGGCYDDDRTHWSRNAAQPVMR